jgi:hypothetical protein
MNAKDLKEILADVPDHWIVVVEQPEGDRYQTQGARGDKEKGELLLEL